MSAAPMTLAAALAAGAALLAGCGGSARSGTAPRALGRPLIGTVAASPPSSTVARPAAPSPRKQSHPATSPWLTDPDHPLPTHSPWAPVLRAARRFAAAYVAYDTGRLTGAVRRALEQSCTPRFAHELLTHAPVVPPGLGTKKPDEGVRTVDPLKHLPASALVLVAVRRILDGIQSTGAIELRLVETQGHWLVDALSVLS